MAERKELLSAVDIQVRGQALEKTFILGHSALQILNLLSPTIILRQTVLAIHAELGAPLARGPFAVASSSFLSAQFAGMADSGGLVNDLLAFRTLGSLGTTLGRSSHDTLAAVRHSARPAAGKGQGACGAAIRSTA